MILHRIERLVLCAALGLVALSLTLPAFAREPFNVDAAKVALHGYDAVGYFVDGRPVPGDPAFNLEWGGAKWQFSSAKNRDRFAAEPESFIPQYGGYCAKAVSEGNTADIDPRAWKVVDGKLYLNYSPKVQKIWEADIPSRIARANAEWPKLLAE